MPVALASLAAPPDIRDLLRLFAEGRNGNTLRAYRADVDAFATHIGTASAEDGAAALLAAGPGSANGMILSWRSAMLAAGLAASTVNRRLAALRSVVRLARMLGIVTWTIEVPGVKSEARRDMRGPAAEILRAMLSGARQRTDAKGLRDRAILALLADLALRRAEVSGLDVEHVDLSVGTVRVLRKNHRERVTLALTAAAAKALGAWMHARPGVPTGPLFVALDPGADGERLSPGAIYAVVRAVGFRAGVTTSPHRIRHSAVTAAVRGAAAAGLSLADVTQYSGHRNAVTLQRYVDADRNVQGRLAAIVSATLSGE